MSKSNLRREYEARMGTVDGTLRLFNGQGQEVYREESEESGGFGFWILHKYNDEGKQVYYENSRGDWAKYKYNDEGKKVYYENSQGTVTDNRPSKAKLVTDENGTQYKLVEITKMNKSQLRKEYEARMGVVEGDLQLFDAVGERVYYENFTGYWARREYNEAGKEVYFESSSGGLRDNRPPKAKIVTDQDGKQYELVELVG